MSDKASFAVDATPDAIPPQGGGPQGEGVGTAASAAEPGGLEARLRRQTELLDALARRPSGNGGEWLALLRDFTATAGETLGVSRASIWLFTPARDAIECVDLYETGSRRHSPAPLLRAATYPHYFKALAEQRVIAAADARTDPRTREFETGYLIPLDIHSMLDAPLLAGGQLIGVICLEQAGAARVWRLEEELFAATVADRIALAWQTLEARLAEATLHASEQRYRTIFERSLAGFFRSTLDGKMLDCNPAFVRQLGYGSREEILNASALNFYFNHEERQRYLARLQAEKALNNYEIRLRRKDGSPVWVMETVAIVEDPAGGRPLIEGTMIDVSELKQSRQALEHSLSQLTDSEERYRAFITNSAEAVWRCEIEPSVLVNLPEDEQIGQFYRNGFLAECNNAMAQMYGHASADELTGLKLGALLLKSDPQNLELLRAFIRGGYRTSDQESHEIGEDGRKRYFLNAMTGIVRDGRLLRVWGTQRDITAQREMEIRLEHAAFHDALTGLPNRALFISLLKHSAERNRRHPERRFAVLFLDIDRFKGVNDSLGHSVGDDLLVGVARRLEPCLRPGDTVARLGGDEFAILVEDIGAVSDSTHIAERILQALAGTFHLGGQEIYITASIGIAIAAGGPVHPDDVLRDADTAMYRAKAQGKARYQIFDAQMHARAVALLQMESDMRRGLERGEFEAHFQPVIDLLKGTVTGFEALVRWNHPERGEIMPVEFLPLAEETGLIVAIDRLVLQQSARRLAIWQKAVGRPLTMSVNFSAPELLLRGQAEVIAAILAEAGIAPGQINLEITESILLENSEAALGNLERLRATGLRLHLDDFGTGYSSLSYLHRYPFDTLKIDQSFVCRLPGGEAAEIVNTIISLARNLKMSVIAEGIDSPAQMEALCALSCDAGQGYYFARPMAGDKVLDFLSAKPHW